MFVRSEIEIIKKRIAEKRRFIQVITGPRQVGKSTLIQQYLSMHKGAKLYLSADAMNSSAQTRIVSEWDAIRVKMQTEKIHEFLLVIDEIQKVHNWSEIIKAEWEKDTRQGECIKLVLLGSSRLLLQKGLNESLAGRFEVIKMTHWSLSEMREAFGYTPEQFAWYGGYPAAADLISEEKRWKEYIRDSLIEPAISKDILMLDRVDKPALLRNVFELGCLYSGQALSYTKMLGQLHDAGHTTTIAHYLRLLEQAGLLTPVSKYSHSSIRTRASIPKLVVQNTALMSGQLEESFNVAKKNSALWGRVMEPAVGAHLLNCSMKEGIDVYYWKAGNDEIDFVLKYGKQLIGIEVKSGENIRAKGLEAFRKQFNPDKIILLSSTGLSWQKLLEMNPRDLF